MKIASALACVAIGCLFSGAAHATVPLSGLVGYWTGNGNANDSSTTGNNGTFTGSYASGPGGKGQSFNLATGSVTIADNPAYQISYNSSFSVGFWFNFNGNTYAQDIIGQDIGPGGNPKWFIDYNYFNPGAFEFLAGPSLFTVNGPSATPTGWKQLTLTVENGVYTFYLDGVNEGSSPGADPGYQWPDPDAPLVFSFADGGSPYAGDLADVVIYNRALSASEVGELASLSSVPEPAPWAMMLMGFAGLGFAAYRSARNGTATLQPA
jgi:Concanavalin A-like lectin/glucanases superfamily